MDKQEESEKIRYERFTGIGGAGWTITPPVKQENTEDDDNN